MQPSLKYSKWIYDCVHGYIGVTEVERSVIDTRIFQRLHYVRQLGAAYFVYPGAVHTRFSHSLGSMFVMGKIAEKFMSSGYISDWDEVQKLRLAALLHDLGHYPFSHALEALMRRKSGEKAKHERISSSIIQRTELRDKISKNYDPNEILAIMTRTYTKNPLFSPLMDSDLDVDKIDYLLRDAHHTGVSYGFIDLERIIRTLDIDEEKRMAILEKGRQALENMLIARYHMYQTVYYHKTVAAFELKIQKIYEKLLGENPPLVYDIDSIYKLEGDSLFSFNDNYLWGAVAKSTSETVKELVSYLSARTPLQVAYEAPALSLSGQATEQYHKMQLLELPKHIEGLSKESGIEEDWIFYARPPALELLANPKDETAIRVIMDNNESIPLVEYDKSIIYHLYKYHFLNARVYTKKDFLTKLYDGLKRYFGF